MSVRLSVAFGFAAIAILLSSRAFAEETRTPPGVEKDPWTRPLALDGHLGLGTPVGLVGATLEATPIPFVTAGAGIGMSANGPQGAIDGRLRLPLGATAIAIGGGLSAGRYERGGFMCGLYGSSCTIATWDRAAWANAEVSIEHRRPSGLELRFYVGRAALLTHEASSCVVHQGDAEAMRAPSTHPCAPSAYKNVSVTLPYVGFAVGHAFDL